MGWLELLRIPVGGFRRGLLLDGVRPGDLFAVKLTMLQAAVEDAHEPVADRSQGLFMVLLARFKW